MGYKTIGLNNLKRMNINVHTFQEVNNYEDLYNYAMQNDQFTIRFDKNIEKSDLPFYKADKNDFKGNGELIEYLKQIASLAKETNCTMLCANGLKYDIIQLFNFVGVVTRDLDFTLEISNMKVPLRHMYRYPTTVIQGNMADKIKDMNFINATANPISNRDLNYIIAWLCDINQYNKNIEGTLYPVEVGILNQRIVCWQLDETKKHTKVLHQYH